MKLFHTHFVELFFTQSMSYIIFRQNLPSNQNFVELCFPGFTFPPTYTRPSESNCRIRAYQSYAERWRPFMAADLLLSAPMKPVRTTWPTHSFSCGRIVKPKLDFFIQTRLFASLVKRNNLVLDTHITATNTRTQLPNHPRISKIYIYNRQA